MGVVCCEVLYVENIVSFPESRETSVAAEIAVVTFSGATEAAGEAAMTATSVVAMGGATVVTAARSGASRDSVIKCVKFDASSVSSCSGLKAEI